MIKNSPNVEYIGEINEKEKARFLGEALALLFPVDWPEPFGLVIIEAMACGTPVIAFRRGAVSEIVDDGTSGFIVDTVAQAVAAVQRISTLDRRRVRSAFEHRFTADRMARKYVEVYQTLSAGLSEPVRKLPTRHKHDTASTRVDYGHLDSAVTSKDLNRNVLAMTTDNEIGTGAPQLQISEYDEI
jgi:hypothetical protein